MSKLLDVMKKHKLIIIIILLIILILFIGNFVYSSLFKISNLAIELKSDTDAIIYYGPYQDDKTILKTGDKIELAIISNPNKNSLFVSCYYDKDVISYKNNVITAKASGSTSIYCVSGIFGKIKSNTIEIEVQK